jgi:hypothetical protein
MDPKYFNIQLNDQPLRMTLVYPNTTIGEIKSYVKRLLEETVNPKDSYKIDIYYDSKDYFTIYFRPQSIDDIPLSSKWDEFTEPRIVITDPDYISSMGDTFSLVTAQLNYHDMINLCQSRKCSLVDWRSHLHHYFLVDDIPKNAKIQDIKVMSMMLQFLKDIGIPISNRTYNYHLSTIDILENVDNRGRINRKTRKKYRLNTDSIMEMREILGLDDGMNEIDSIEEEEMIIEYLKVLDIPSIIDNLELFLYWSQNGNQNVEEVYSLRANNIIRYLLDTNISFINRQPVDIYGLYFSPILGYDRFDKDIARELINRIPKQDLIDFVKPNLYILNKAIDVSDLINLIDSM